MVRTAEAEIGGFYYDGDGIAQLGGGSFANSAVMVICLVIIALCVSR